MELSTRLSLYCVLSRPARYLSPRGLDCEDRRLWLGHGEVSVERLSAGGAAQWLHPVDGESIKPKVLNNLNINNGKLWPKHACWSNSAFK